MDVERGQEGPARKKKKRYSVIDLAHWQSKGDIGLAQPGLPGGAFRGLPQGPGEEVVGDWPHVVAVLP